MPSAPDITVMVDWAALENNRSSLSQCRLSAVCLCLSPCSKDCLLNRSKWT